MGQRSNSLVEHSTHLVPNSVTLLLCILDLLLHPLATKKSVWSNLMMLTLSHLILNKLQPSIHSQNSLGLFLLQKNWSDQLVDIRLIF
jgi:hypothetical protein